MAAHRYLFHLHVDEAGFREPFSDEPLGGGGGVELKALPDLSSLWLRFSRLCGRAVAPCASVPEEETNSGKVRGQHAGPDTGSKTDIDADEPQSKNSRLRRAPSLRLNRTSRCVFPRGPGGGEPGSLWRKRVRSSVRDADDTVCGRLSPPHPSAT